MDFPDDSSSDEQSIKKSDQKRALLKESEDSDESSDDEQKMPAKPTKKNPPIDHHTVGEKRRKTARRIPTHTKGLAKDPRTKNTVDQDILEELELVQADETEFLIPLTQQEAEKQRAKFPPVGVVPVKNIQLKALRLEVPIEINSKVLKAMGKVNAFQYTKRMNSVLATDGFMLKWLVKKMLMQEMILPVMILKNQNFNACFIMMMRI